MSGIRPLEAADVPAVAALHRRVFTSSAPAGPPATGSAHEDDLESFLDTIFCRHPWQDPDLPSLVYEHEGRVVGCLGVMPRPMTMDGRRLRVAVTHNFMVDPGARATLAALHLSRAAFHLPHDLLLADGNDASRAIWERGGGTTSLCHSLRWRRLLSPARYAISGASENGGRGRVLEPLMQGIDRLVRRRAPRMFGVPASEDSGETLEPSTLLSCAEQAAKRRVLRPLYDRGSAAWLLHQLDRRKEPVEFRRVLVRDPDGRPVGWYLYFARPGGIAEVVQAVAVGDELERVLAHLFRDAWSRDAIGVAGGADPLHMQELTASGCLLDGGRSWLLVHARDPQVTAAIQRGDVFLTRLECEGWIRLAHL